MTSPSVSVIPAECFNLEAIRKDTLETAGIVYRVAFVRKVRQELTAHKESERERRQRLRHTLAELQRRLLSANTSPLTRGGKIDKRCTNQAICKAATIEAAIVYIASLEQRLAMANPEVHD